MRANQPVRRATAAIAVALLAAAGLAACGDDASDESTTATTEAAAGEVIAIDGAWARTSPAVADAGAAYMEITNNGDEDDALIGASVDASVAGKVEIHETVAADDSMTDDTAMGEDSMTGGTAMDDETTTTAMGGDSMTEGTASGMEMMEMRPVDQIAIAAGETVSLEPGGYHVMLLELPEPLEVGTSFTLTLTFEKAGEIEVTVEVRDSAP